MTDEGETCGITLINNDQLLTCTQCVEGLTMDENNPKGLYDGSVVLGISNYYDFRMHQYPIVDIQASFERNGAFYSNNIAVVTVSEFNPLIYNQFVFNI